VGYNFVADITGLSLFI